MLADGDWLARTGKRRDAHLVWADQIVPARRVDVDERQQVGRLLADELDAIAVANLHDDL